MHCSRAGKCRQGRRSLARRHPWGWAGIYDDWPDSFQPLGFLYLTAILHRDRCRKGEHSPACIRFHVPFTRYRKRNKYTSTVSVSGLLVQDNGAHPDRLDSRDTMRAGVSEERRAENLRPHPPRDPHQWPRNTAVHWQIRHPTTSARPSGWSNGFHPSDSSYSAFTPSCQRQISTTTIRRRTLPTQLALHHWLHQLLHLDVDWDPCLKLLTRKCLTDSRIRDVRHAVVSLSRRPPSNVETEDTRWELGLHQHQQRVFPYPRPQ